jgi:hypothetical protein
VIESAIESLARSGRVVRIRELSLGYMRPVRAACSGAFTALALTWTVYLWYPLLWLLSHFLGLVANQRIGLGPPPEFHVFPAGLPASVVIAGAGALLALIRRWSIRRGRLIVVEVGAIAQIRAGWHAPVALLGFVGIALLFADGLDRLPGGFRYLALAAGSIVALIAWEVLHDIVMPLFATPKERRRAAVEFDLKEALAQDETALRWRVERLWFDPDSRVAVLQGDFPDPRARNRAREVALRVSGVEDVRLEQIKP